MKKMTLVDQYSKYLVAIRREDSDVVQCFAKMLTLLSKSEVDSPELIRVLEVDAIYEAILQVRKRSIDLLRVKGYPQWQKSDIDRCWELIRALSKADEDFYSDSHDLSGSGYTRLFQQYCSLTVSQPPHARLYMHYALSNHWKEYKKDKATEFYGSERSLTKRLLKARTEEEIDEILTVQPSESDLVDMASSPVKLGEENKPAPTATNECDAGWKRWEKLTADAWELVFAIRELKEKDNIPDENLEPAAERILEDYKYKWSDIDTVYGRPFDIASHLEKLVHIELNRLLKKEEQPKKEKELMEMEDAIATVENG